MFLPTIIVRQRPHLSTAGLKIISDAQAIADRMGLTCVDDVHLMLGIMGNASMANLLVEGANVDMSRLRSELVSLFSNDDIDGASDGGGEFTEESISRITTDLGNPDANVRMDAIKCVQAYLARSADVILGGNRTSTGTTQITSALSNAIALGLTGILEW